MKYLAISRLVVRDRVIMSKLFLIRIVIEFRVGVVRRRGGGLGRGDGSGVWNYLGRFLRVFLGISVIVSWWFEGWVGCKYVEW